MVAYRVYQFAYLQPAEQLEFITIDMIDLYWSRYTNCTQYHFWHLNIHLSQLCAPYRCSSSFHRNTLLFSLKFGRILRKVPND